MKIPSFTEIGIKELRNKSADELCKIFHCYKLGTALFDSWVILEQPNFGLLVDVAVWGTYGPSGEKHALKWVKLKNYSTEHLNKILKQVHGATEIGRIIHFILNARKLKIDKINKGD